ncbi:MAG: SPOR domain-containing protein [Deltaproteobacteria bacterium]|nr:SPOR domain-containing protein [Deltaproteobacteria bacterium]
MRLRDEGKLKPKMEFQFETRHFFLLVVWSIPLSVIIFCTGLFIGQKGQAGTRGVTLNNPQGNGPEVRENRPDPLLSSLSFLSRLVRHPEKRQHEDAALDALAALREDILKKQEREDAVLRAQLEREVFSPPAAPPVDPQQVLASSNGVQATLGRSRQANMGLVPDLSALAAPVEPEPVPVPEAQLAAELPEPVAPLADPAHVQEPAARADGLPQGDPSQIEVNADGRQRFYAIQAKAFREKSDADVFLGYLQQELTRSEYKAFIMPVELPGKGKWYRVRIGKFQTRLDAEKFKQSFEKKLGLETFLVTL